MAGLTEGVSHGLSDAQYTFIVGTAEARLRIADPRSLGVYGRKDIVCAASVLAICATVGERLRDVREELDLSSKDAGYRLAVAMFRKAHQIHTWNYRVVKGART